MSPHEAQALRNLAASWLELATKCNELANSGKVDDRSRAVNRAVALHREGCAGDLIAAIKLFEYDDSRVLQLMMP